RTPPCTCGTSPGGSAASPLAPTASTSPSGRGTTSCRASAPFPSCRTAACPVQLRKCGAETTPPAPPPGLSVMVPVLALPEHTGFEELRSLLEAPGNTIPPSSCRLLFRY